MCAYSLLATGPNSTSGATSPARTSNWPSIYYAHQRPVYQRDGMWMTPGAWGGPADDEELEIKSVRYRTVGDGSTTGAILSDAADNEAILAEVAASRLTERGATRGDDRVSEAAMEDRKREGYF